MHITFLLTPDRFSAHFIRRELSTKACLFGVQVGTWTELLELARTSYCLPNPEDDWRKEVEKAMTEMPRAFWTKSMLYDAETTVTMVTGALSDLLWSVGPKQQIKTEGLSRRGKKQISDLLRLHKKAGKIFPRDLDLIRSLLKVKRNQAIRSISVNHVDGIPQLNPWQTCLIEMLNRRGNENENSAVDLSSFAPLLSWTSPAGKKSGLRHLQRFLFSKTREKQKSRSGLQWIAVRDYMQEIEIAAGMVQQLMDNS